MSRTALLVGATGLVGGRLLTRLLAHPMYDRVTIWVRRPVSLQIHKFAQLVVDFERLHDYASQLDAEDVYVALGTTMKKAGSKEIFRHVDFDYPVTLAGLAKQHGARRFLMVSSLGANPQSSLFYNRVKGEAEEAVRDVRIEQTWLFRPSLLVGTRTERRLGERIAIALSQTLNPFLLGPLARYRSIRADAVAAAMVYVATHDLPEEVFESEEIARLARQA